MAPTFGPDDVRRLAELARLELTDAEVELFTKQLAEILAYADAVQQVDTSGVSPTSHVLPTDTAWRDDVPAPSLDHDEALAIAPDPARDAGLYRVPKVL